MARTVSAKAKKKQIVKYMETHFHDENFDVLEDLLEEDNPSIALRTKSRYVSLWCDDSGQVQENFKLADGADEENYTLRKKAYIALNSEILLNYKDSAIVKDSFENSFIMLEDKTKTVSLNYDFDQMMVVKEEKEKKAAASKKASEELDGQLSLFDMDFVKKADEKTESKKSKQEPKEVKIEIPKAETKQYSVIHEGTQIKSIYSDKIYTVINDLGNILKVKDKDNNSFQIPRSDCEI